MRPAPAWILLSTLVLAACSGGDSGPYLAFSGGGFLFNYRIAEATEQLVVGALRTLPEGATIEVTFDDPGGGAPIVQKQTATGPSTRERYTFEFVTPALHGIKKGVECAVTARLIGPDGKELQKLDKKFHSDLDQSALPEKPLTIGPGYTKNPDANTQ